MNKQQKIPLYEALIEHANKNPISFHVPGHKYGGIVQSEADIFYEQILKIDATEISGLDDLHAAEGAILEAETLLAELFQTQKSCFLVNGSTVGNLAMIMAACSEGDKVLVQRNCHKSVLNGLRLAKARPVFLEPDYNQEWKTAAGISVETVKRALISFPDAKALILTYPNYYGLVNDVQAIIHLAHHHHIPVLVDEAHGAHFIIGEPFPASAVQLGADIVVQSAHKSLPAMTMGSFLHFNSQFIKIKKVKEYLEMLQSSSPSYPIMASLDLARKYLAGYNNRDIAFLLEEISCFKAELAEIPAIRVLEYPENRGDYLKVTIQSRCGLSGFELQKQLEGLGIYTELADPYNVLFMLPLLKEGQEYPLKEVGLKLRQALAGLSVKEPVNESYSVNREISELAIPYQDMEKFKEKSVHIKEAANHICAETIIPYPPGIPLLLKGEKITAAKLNELNRLLESGARFQGGFLLKTGLISVFGTA